MSVEVLTIDSEDYVIFPHLADWSRKPVFSWSWLDAVQAAATGAEERISLRDQEAHSLGFEILPVDFQEQKRLEQRILAATELGRAVVPYRGRGMKLAQDTTGTTIFFTAATVSWPFYEGQKLFFQQPGRTAWDSWEIVDVFADVGGSPYEVELDAVLGDNYQAGTWVFPILWGKFEAEDLEALNYGSGHIQIRVSQIVPFPAGQIATCVGIVEFFESTSDDYAVGEVTNPSLLVGGCGFLADCSIVPNLVASVARDFMESYSVGAITGDNMTGGIQWNGSTALTLNRSASVALDTFESYPVGSISGEDINGGTNWSGEAALTSNT